MHPLLIAAAAAQHGVVTRRDLLLAGVDDQEIRRGVARGDWVRLRRGAYVRAGDLATAEAAGQRHRVECAAVLLTLDRASTVVSGPSAAWLWGLPVAPASLRQVDLADPAHSEQGKGYRMHKAPLPADSTTTQRGLSVTSLARTVADCARTEGFEDGVVIADAARWDDRLDLADLEAVVSTMDGWTGVAGARRVLGLTRAGVESPLETRSRLRVVGAGLPEPETLVTIRVGGRALEVDGWWDAAGVAMECDGRVKYRDPWGGLSTEEKHWREKRRAEVAVAAGVRFWRVADEDLVTPTAWRASVARLQMMLDHPATGPRSFTVERELRRVRRAA